MARVINLDQIKSALKTQDVAQAIENGFVAYSQGKTSVPPVGELIFEEPPGETHIKYGYIKGDDYYVVKIASGFFENAKLGLPSSSGLMLVFSQKTGVLDTVLLDEGYLTDVRTAFAGQIAAKYLVSRDITRIGIYGTGVQARYQVQYLKPITDCKKIVVWGRSQGSLETYKTDMLEAGYDVTTTLDSGEVTDQCNLIVTTTPSKEPLIYADQVKPGTHITAMGSDTSEKQELDPEILANADIVVADSISQCRERGEIYKAHAAGALDFENVVELGNVIGYNRKYRQFDKQVTVADLTGVAVQDIQIAKSVCEALK